VEFVIVLVVLVVVVFVVTGPLRRERVGRDSAADAAGERVAELEAARDAKYREIRDAELDHQTGKLSDADYETLDKGLRAEAVEIMHALDESGGQTAPAPTDPPAAAE
jgi:flagellar biosynthesis/type III secretory pathway M-ring protein FliF/YscJ